MSFRDWRTRRIVGLALAWMFGVFVWVATVSTLRTREEERKHPDAAVYVSVHVSGGLSLVFGPPVLFVAAWLWSRRSRPAS
jgi:hypothetical protein